MDSTPSSPRASIVESGHTFAQGPSIGRERAFGILVLVGLIFLYAPTVAWLFERWTMSVWHNVHGMLIPPIVAYIVWQELRGTETQPTSSSAVGFVLLIPALLLQAVDAGLNTQLLSAFSIVLVVPGLSFVLLGAERTRQVLFPLGFLVFMLPIPLSFTEQIHLGLRGVATAGSSSLIAAVGVPVFTEGTTIHLASATLQVADACSGFSTLYATAAIACLVAYLSRSTWRRLAVLLIAAPVAVGANILRVAVLCLLVLWKGDDILATSLHTISGLATFALALPIILWVGRETEEAT